jgi:hypothetical protein
MVNGITISAIPARSATSSTLDEIPTGTVMKNAKGKTVGKAQLPEKICLSCNKPFAWRKKWARDWEHVVYCSDKCRAIGKA